MMHMLLLPFLPITALIVQNSTTLSNLLQYQRDVASIGDIFNCLAFYVLE